MAGFLALAWVSLFHTLRARWRAGPLRPSWSFAFEWTIRWLRLDWERTASWPLPRLRAYLSGRPAPRDQLRRVRVHEETLGGVPVLRLVPPGAREDRVVLFFHGGSFVYGSVRDTHADFAARLALGSASTLIGVEYRLAPEHPRPAQLEDAVAAFDALVAGGRRHDEIVLAGDSAGGALALGLQLALRDRGGPQARSAALLSPWVDLEMRTPAYAAHEPFDIGSRPLLVEQAHLYAGGTPLDDPRVSPIHASLAGLSPVLVVAGGAELLHDDVVELARRLEAAGVSVTRHVAPDMPHDCALFAAFHPHAAAALGAMTSFLAR